MTPPASAEAVDPELQMAKPKPPPVKFPEMPWKKNPKTAANPQAPSAKSNDSGEKP
jgi:hypothetical protein